MGQESGALWLRLISGCGRIVALSSSGKLQNYSVASWVAGAELWLCFEITELFRHLKILVRKFILPILVLPHIRTLQYIRTRNRLRNSRYQLAYHWSKTCHCPLSTQNIILKKIFHITTVLPKSVPLLLLNLLSNWLVVNFLISNK